MKRGATLALALLLGGAPAWAQPAAAEPEPAHVVTSQRGDTLIGLGRRYLVEPRRWPELARANAIRNPDRIATGAELRIPLRLMRSEPAQAALVGVVGQASTVLGGPLQAGQALNQGDEIGTGPDGHVTLRLVDGTLLRLRPDSRLQIRESRRLRDVGVVRSGARLERGRVEVDAAPAPAGRPGFQIDTPQGVLGVRGTEFRVAADPATQLTRGEVLGGTVLFAGRGAAALPVAGGFGATLGAPDQAPRATPLLGAPDTRALPALQERLLVRFALAPLPDAVAYRGLVARDAAFEDVLADLTSTTPELRFAGLPDGDYRLRVRGIDAQGLEGRDADFAFRLKARPEAPLPASPAPRAVLFGDRVEFAWTANDAARAYRLQLSATPDFAAPLRDLGDLATTTAVLDGLAPGLYHWRLASIRGADDRGPWGDARMFELRPLPPAPKPPAVGDRQISFAWEGRPGQRFDFEVARDAAFAQRVFVRQLDRPAIELPLSALGTGSFHVRLRATDADGFVGPYTTPQRFEIPNCARDGQGACVRVGDAPLLLAP